MADARQNRRDVLLGLIGAAAVGGLAHPAQAGATDTAPSATPSGSTENASGVEGLLHPIQVGDGLAYGWQLEAVTDAHQGSAVLSLAHPEQGRARVHVCSREGSGLASTRHYDLYLMDGRNGAEPTPEALGRVVHGLAFHLKRTEGATALPGLLTHTERLARYGGGLF